ncbi:vitellogenin-A2 [Bactrocera dorsalis]|uniref:Vitellogenin-A2 n=1 Tax=Bactrocera dorsalis TaxID=27457 RepID=A0A034V500_BACDO|nr:vitellogenin-A2 [Bactrocera dorsalis]XP_011211368.1 vitellogenin-A2 [Bactrocera dorsalis]
MTYSHNSVSNNFKMTTTAAADATTIRLKKISNVGGVGNVSRNTPTTTLNVTAHSNSIASSTNYQSYYQQQVLSSSPPGCEMSSGASTSSTSSDSSLGSSGFGSGNNSSRQRKQQQRKQQQNQQHQQRDSPPLSSGTESAVFFSNNNNHYQSHHGGRRGGSAHKLSDGQKSPHFQQQQARQSPAVILGGGENPIAINSNSSSAGRKTRAKFAMISSPLFGKISPTQLALPTALTHFAGSKCFDAPSPTALPKPPQHWTLGKAEHKATSSAGPGLHSVTTARNPALAADAHTCGGHVVKHSKRNLLDDFDTHNLKLLLNVQS